MKKIKWFTILALVAVLALAGCSSKSADHSAKAGTGGTKSIVIAEPVHLIAYLPLYVAIDKGYFKKEGLDVKVTTATGGAHVTSVVSGDAWETSEARNQMRWPTPAARIRFSR